MKTIYFALGALFAALALVSCAGMREEANTANAGAWEQDERGRWQFHRSNPNPH